MKNEKKLSWIVLGLTSAVSLSLLVPYLIMGFVFGWWGFNSTGFDAMPLIFLFFGLILLLPAISSFFYMRGWKYAWWITILGAAILIFLEWKFIE